jgi:ribonuclease G
MMNTSNMIVMNAASYETRIVLVERNAVVELYTERRSERGILGNIYKGKVIRVLPGMQAAFVDIGLDRAAFLYVSDISKEALNEDFDVIWGGDREDGAMDAEEGDQQETPGRLRNGGGRYRNIQDLLREGQELMVQVAKDPIGTKGARLTSHVTLPGRYLVFMPTIDHVGISRRIAGDGERRRLRDIIERVRPPGTGFIVRTVSEGEPEENLVADMKFLIGLWREIVARNEKQTAPSMLHADFDLVLRATRDLFTPAVDRLVVDDRQEFERIRDFVRTFMPSQEQKIELYEKDEPIFDTYQIEVEISRALARKVWLKSGGYIVIDQAEALTAIDVNTGKYVGKRNLEDTITKINLEATLEIAYQLRLRNIGGIIILDFIDMDRGANRDKVFKALDDALKRDKVRTTIVKISELGLVEMTRKRTRESIGRMISEPCFYCEGRGFIKSRQTVCYEIFREVMREAPYIPQGMIAIRANPELADCMLDEERKGIEELERRYGKRIIIQSVPEFHREQFEVRGTTRG